MPPKKKATSKIIDGVDTSSMTREQLEEFSQRIKEENDREREERNFFQIERDKIKTFWEITKAELEEAQAQLRNKDRQIEEADERNEEEIKLSKQKLKHLQYEHQNSLTEAKAETLVILKKAQDDYAKQERELLQDKRDLTKLIKEQELSNQEKMKALKLEHSEALSKARVEFETRVKEMDTKYEAKVEELRSHLTLKYEMEISQLGERKNEHITELIKNSEKAFNDMKNYYNDIVLNNLALISCLKDQMEVLRKQNERMNKQVGDLTAENKRLAVPLNKALEEVKDYNKKLQSYERDKLALLNNKLQLGQKTKALDDLRWSYDALELRFDTLQKERDELHNRFVSAVMEVQQKSGFQNLNKNVNRMLRKKGVKVPKWIDGVETSVFNKAKLEEYALKIVDIKNKEKQERANFQIERDKIRTFWEISKRDLEEVRAQLKNRDRQIEEAQEKNEEELKLSKQRVKHFQFEHQKALTEAKTETIVALSQKETEYTSQIQQQLRDNLILQNQLKELENNAADQIIALKLQNSEDINKARVEFEAIAKEIQLIYEKKFAGLRSRITSKYDTEITKIETLKDDYIDELTKHHDSNFVNMQNYYNDITFNNLAFIGRQKTKMDDLRTQNERMTNYLAELKGTLKPLEKRIKNSKEEIKIYQKKMEDYQKDQLALDNVKTALAEKLKEYEYLQWTYDALESGFETLKKETDELRSRYSKAILEVQQKTSVKSLLLNKRIETLSQSAEHKDAVISELQNAAIYPPSRSNKKLEEILAKKNATISDLQYELARVCKAHDDLLDNMEDKLKYFNIPKSELGFIPLKINPDKM